MEGKKVGTTQQTVSASEVLAKSIQRGKQINEKIESLKGMLSKGDTGGEKSKKVVDTFKDPFMKRSLEKSQVYPVDARPPIRDTVIETTDIDVVKAKVEQLVQKLKPEAQQNVLDDTLLFTDPEFGSEAPGADPDSIFFSSETLAEDFSKGIDFSRIQWKRIKDIAANPYTAGFDKIEGGEEEGPHRSLIVQGLIGDNWFLSALTAVFHHDYLFTRLTCGDTFLPYRDYGLYVFRFFQDNSQFYVIIDDKLPVIERETGELVPVFSRCLNPNLFWAPFLEKAFAKLHHRYYSLHNGYIEDALYGLTGLNPESVVLDADHILNSNEAKFVDCLKVLTLSGACVCACPSFTRIALDSKRSDIIKREIMARGLMPNQWYHVDDIRDMREFAEKPVPFHRFVRMHCPWGLALEAKKQWSGDFAYEDARWTEHLKDRFNAYYLEQKNRYDEEVFANNFLAAGCDGHTILPVEDFLHDFNSLVVLRDYPRWYNGIEYSHHWLPSHGHPNIKNANWMNNPHYIIRIQRKLQELTPITILLQQKDPRFLCSPNKGNYLSIGLVVLSMSGIETDVKYYDAKRNVGFIKPTESRFVSWSASLASGKYCIIPVTKNAGDVAPFFLKIYYACRNDEVTLTNPEFKVIMELEKSVTHEAVDKKGMREELKEPGGNTLAATNTMRVVDATLSSKMIATFLEKGNMRKWTEKVLTPFSLDGILNPPLLAPTKPSAVSRGSLSPIKASRTKERTAGVLMRESEHDLELRLYDRKLDKEKEEDKIAVLLGIEEGSRSRFPMTELEVEQNEIAFSSALSEASNTLDLNYYYLGDKGLLSILDEIEISPVSKLLLRGNQIGDEGVIKLCQSIEESHKGKLEYLDLGENSFSIKGAESLYALMERMGKLRTLLFDGNDRLNTAITARLQFICDSKSR